MYILDYNTFEAHFDVRECDTLNFFLFFFQNCFDNLWCFVIICGPIQILGSICVKNAMTILRGVALNV